MDGEHRGSICFDDDVAADGELVTARGYGQNAAVLKEFLRMLAVRKGVRPGSDPFSHSH